VGLHPDESPLACVTNPDFNERAAFATFHAAERDAYAGNVVSAAAFRPITVWLEKIYNLNVASRRRGAERRLITAARGERRSGTKRPG
jgi:hypothetical protein